MSCSSVAGKAPISDPARPTATGSDPGRLRNGRGWPPEQMAAVQAPSTRGSRRKATVQKRGVSWRSNASLRAARTRRGSR